MKTDLPLRCACGAVRGRIRGISAGTVNRVVCYCDDCQAFAHFLGHADRILDPHGGTDISQMSPARLEFTHGEEYIAAMRLTATGLHRWYASCCRTPIGNTLSAPRLPFVGVIHSFVDHAGDGRARDAVMGKVRARVNARFARDRSKLDATDGLPVGNVIRFAGMLLVSWLRREQRHSPFFDAETGQPRVQAHILSDEELREVQRVRDGL